MRNLHKLKADDVLSRLDSSAAGLSGDLLKGQNYIFPEKRRALYEYLAPLYTAPLFLLFAITVCAAFLAEAETVGYIALGLFAALLYGWYYAYRFSLDHFDRMRRRAEGFSRVIREGKLWLVPNEDLLVGDILLLQRGDAIPADCRVLSESELFVSESAVLAKKARNAKKTAAACPEASYEEADNMLWAGSVVSEGSARCVVVAVGSTTRIGVLAEKNQSPRFVEGDAAKLLKKLSLTVSSVLLGIVFLVVILSFTPLSEKGLFNDWLLTVSFAASASAEVFLLILTLAVSTALFRHKGVFCRRIKTVEKMAALDTLILSAEHFKDPSLDGVKTLYVPSEGGVSLEALSPDLSEGGVRILRNALVAMGGLSHPTSQSELLFGEKTVGDHIRAAFDAAKLSLSEESYAVLHAGTYQNGLSYGIFRRPDGVFIALCGDPATLFALSGSVYEGDTIREKKESDGKLYECPDAIGVAIGVLEAEIADRFEHVDELFAYLDGKLVFEGAAILSRGVKNFKKLRLAFREAEITLVAFGSEDDCRMLASQGAKPYRHGAKGFFYLASPTRKEIYHEIRSLRAEGKTVMFEGKGAKSLALMREADLSLFVGKTPNAREAFSPSTEEEAMLSDAPSSARLFADWVLSGELSSLPSLKTALSDAFLRTESAIRYLFFALTFKFLPLIGSLYFGVSAVTAIVLMLLGFGFDTLAVLAILFRHGRDKKRPDAPKIFLAKLYCSLGTGLVSGGAVFTFSLLAERYFSLSAEIFSSVTMLAVSLLIFLCHDILPHKTHKPTLSLGTILTVASAVLVFVLLFSRGSFGKFGLLFMAASACTALASELLSRLVFLKKGAKSQKKVRKSHKKV